MEFYKWNQILGCEIQFLKFQDIKSKHSQLWGIIYNYLNKNFTSNFGHQQPPVLGVSRSILEMNGKVLEVWNYNINLKPKPLQSHKPHS